MATLFAPELNTVGASSMTGGQNAPANIDYSGLFQAINTLTEPKKVSEKELKANDVQRLTYELSKYDAEEDMNKKQALLRMSRRTARANYPNLEEKDIADIYSQFTGELPFAEKTVQEVNKDIIMKSYQEDPEMSMYLASNWAKANGDPDQFMVESMATYHNTVGRRAQLEAAKREIDMQNLSDAQKDKTFKEQFISTLQVENDRLASEYMRLSPAILKQEGLEGLTGSELYSRLSSSVAQLELQARNAANKLAAQNGKVLTKEEEDRAVASFTSATNMFTNMSEETKNSLTAKNAEEMAVFKSSLPPNIRPIFDNPELQSIYIQAIGGRPIIEESFKVMVEKNAGMLDANSLNTNNAGGVDKSVEGPSDSLSTIQMKYKNVFAPEGIASAFRYDDATKLSVITSIRDNIQNPSAVDTYSKTTLNATAKNFMFGYALGLPELDTDGVFTQPKAIEVMFGSKALAYAEALAKKMPVEAPDIWNKINVTADVTAERVLVNLKQNLDTLNTGVFGTPYQNPFSFSIDETGAITGSFVPEAVNKNPSIKKALSNYDVVNLNSVDQATFWKVMSDYASLFDKSNYDAVQESVKSLEILARVSSKVPDGSKRENAFNTINLGLSQLVSGRAKTTEEMTPEEFMATQPSERVRPRVTRGGS